MKVLFISPNAERLFMPTLPLGLALVAAATRRAGHETRFLDLLAAADPLNEVREIIAEFQPEIIALSSATAICSSIRSDEETWEN